MSTGKAQSFPFFLFLLQVMIELTELQCERLGGGYGGYGRGRGRGLGAPAALVPSGPITNTSTSTSLSGIVNVNPQINVAVNLAMFSSFIDNTQGNGSALLVA